MDKILAKCSFVQCSSVQPTLLPPSGCWIPSWAKAAGIGLQILKHCSSLGIDAWFCSKSLAKTKEVVCFLFFFRILLLWTLIKIAWSGLQILKLLFWSFVLFKNYSITIKFCFFFFEIVANNRKGFCSLFFLIILNKRLCLKYSVPTPSSSSCYNCRMVPGRFYHFHNIQSKQWGEFVSKGSYHHDQYVFFCLFLIPLIWRDRDSDFLMNSPVSSKWQGKLEISKIFDS